MKLTSFTRDDSSERNFRFLKPGSGRFLMIPFLALSLMLFMSNSPINGGLFKNMFQKAQENMFESFSADVMPMAPMSIGTISTTGVAACDDGAGNVTFSVTFDGFTPPLDPPYQIIVSYMSDIGRQNITVMGVTPASATPTVDFGPVTNAMNGTVIIEQVSNNSGGVEVIDNTPLAYTIATTPSGVATGTYGPVCETDGVVALTGTSTPAPGGAVTGTWSGPGVTDADNSDNTGSFDPGTAGVGTHMLTYTVDNLGCTASATTMVTVDAEPTIAAAGADQTLCEPANFVMAANAAVVGTGAWTEVGGPTAGLTITDPASETTTVVVPVGSSVTLRWTISNGSCTASTDDVVLTNDANPTVAAAGADQTLCEPTNFTMAANAAVVGTGAWTEVGGPTVGLTITNASSETTTVVVPVGESVTLRWTITNGVCPASMDDVVLTNDANPTVAAAGADQSQCEDPNFTMAANAAVVGTGMWTEVGGPTPGVNISVTGSPTTTVTGIPAGSSLTFRWTISNGTCPSTSDDVVLTNDQNPTAAAAGPDQALCATTDFTMAANTPAIGTGAWTEVGGPSGATITDPADPATTVTGLAAGSSMTLRWTISNGSCVASMDDVTITNDEDVTPNAGADQNVCGSSTFLAATPSTGTGVWSIIAGGGGSFVTPTDPTTQFNGTLETTYTLRWTETNGACSGSDDVTIALFDNPTAAAAGPDQTVCADNVTLAANTPAIGTGMWSIVAGAGGSFGDASVAGTTFTGTQGVAYTLRWTTSNGPCPVSSDDVVITLDAEPTVAAAGADQSQCEDGTFTLAGNAPVVGTGTWTEVGGPTGGVNITTTGSPTSTVTGIPVGSSLTFRWTITNGVCPPSMDDVVLTNDQNPTIAAAGADQDQCDDANFTLAGNVPVVGTGMWTEVGGPTAGMSITTPNDPASTVTGVPSGTTVTLRWTISNGSCTASTDDVELSNNPNPTVNVVGPSIACRVGSYTIAGNPMGGTAPYTHSWSETGNFAVSIADNGDGTATLNIGFLADQNYTVTYEVTDANGCTATQTISVYTPIACIPQPEIYDPCECIDDADVNADNGTFREVVVVIGPNNAALPAGQTWSVRTATGAYLPDLTTASGPQGGVMPGGGVQVLQYCNTPGGCQLDSDAEVDVPQGGYYLYLEHVDNEGYSVEVEGPAAFGTPANLVLSQDNICFYPEPEILNLPSMVCADDAPLSLQAVPVITGTGSFAGDATYIGGAPAYTYAALPAGLLTDNADGTATLDPGAAAPGCYKISYTFTDNANAGTSEPGCVQVIEADVFIAPTDDPTFTVAGGPFCPAAPLALPLNLTNALTAWPACAPGTAPTDDERVSWYGGDGTNVSVADNADASGTVNIIANAAAGVYTICAEVGVGTCQNNYCVDIAVNPNLTAAAAALVDDQTVCLVPNEVFSLNGLLAPGTSHGGTWTVTGGPTGSLVGNLVGSSVQYLSGAGTLTLTYTVTDCDANAVSDVIVLTIEEKPYGEFSMPSNMCQDGGTVDAVTTEIPTGASISFSSSPVGFITNAAMGTFDPAAGSVAGEFVDVTVTMNVSNPAPTTCPDYNVSQVVRVYASGNPAWVAPAPICLIPGVGNTSLNLTSSLNDGAGAQNLIASNVTWTGEGVENGAGGFGSFSGLVAQFNPTAAGLGVHNICVTVGSPGCEETQCHDITVTKDYVAADVALTADFSLCVAQDDVIDFYSLLMPSADPAGQFSAVFAGVNGQVNGSGFEYNGGCGTVTVTYTFAADCVGATSDVVVITISEDPNYGAIDNPGPVCVTDSPVLLTYSGSSSVCGTTGMFTSTAPGAVTDVGAPLFPGGPSGFFNGTAVTPVPLPGTIPVFQGVHAIFNPTVAGEGIFQVAYNLAPTAPCAAAIPPPSMVITVHATGDAGFTIPDEVCLGDVIAAGGIVLALDAPNASLTDDSEVEWYGGLGNDVNDDNAATVTPIDGLFTPSQAGTFTICVDTGDDDCQQTHCEDIIVHDNAVATIDDHAFDCTIDPSGNISLSSLFTATTTTGGTFSLVSGDGAVVGGSTLQYNGPGCFEVSYTVTNLAGSTACVATDNAFIVIPEQPQPSFDMTEEYCWDGVITNATDDLITVNKNSPSYASGTPTFEWTTDNAAILNFAAGSAAADAEPTWQVAGAGTVEICLRETFTVAAASCGTVPAAAVDCTMRTCHQVTITETNAAVTSAWTSFGPVCQSGAIIDLDARITGTPDGVFTGTGVSTAPTHPNYQFDPSAVPFPAGEDFVDVSICYVVGNGAGCDANTCYTVRVYSDVVATIDDITQCNDANTQIDLTAMYGATTDDGGVFTFTATGTAAGTSTNGLVNAVIAGDILTYDLTLGAPPTFVFDVTYTVGTNPPNGNCMASDASTVTILNSAPTVATCPANITMATPAVTSGTHPHCGVEVDYATPTFNDDCDGNGLIGSLVEGGASGSLFEVGTTNVTWQYIDESGNGPATCAFTVTITDETLPTANCRENGPAPNFFGLFVSLDGVGKGYVSVADLDNGSFDNCGIQEMRLSRNGITFSEQEAFDCSDINKTYTLTLRVKDVAGNEGFCQANVTIKDNEIPDIECPGNIVVPNDPGVCEANVTYPEPVVTDNCGGTALFVGGTSTPTNNGDGTYTSSIAVGTLTVTWEGVDPTSLLEPNRERDTCSFTITVIDAEMPVVDCAPTIRTQTNDAGLCSFSIIDNAFDASATDNCVPPGTLTLTHDYPVSIGYAASMTTLNGATFPVGVTDVIWTAIDPTGNKASCTMQIEISDTENPTIDMTGIADVTVVCGSDIPAVVHPNINDNCLAITDFSEVLVDLSSPDGAQLIRTWNVIDPSGNTASATQTITIEDNVNPVIDMTGIADVTVVCGSDIPAVVHPAITDNCDEVFVDFSEVTTTDASTDEQVLTRTWVATDAAGNSSTASQVITIEDNVDPVIDMTGIADVTVVCGTDIPAVVHPAITDNCDEVFVDFSEVTTTDGSTDEQVLTRTWVATDAAGNSSTASQVITIEDNVDPVIDMTGIADVTVVCGTDIPAVVHPAITDNCDEVFVDFSEVTTTDGSTDEQVLTRTWVATDAAGNSSTASQVITIEDNVDPTITNVPANVTVNCASDIPAVTYPTIADNCDEVFVDFSETLVDEFSTDEQVINRTWVATDAAGNSVSATQVITVMDTEAPMIVTQPSDVTVDCGSDIPVVIPPAFTENCTEFTVDFSEVIVDEFSSDEQIIVRTWVATDEAGNSTIVTQTITINDGIAPAIVSQPSDVTVDCGSDIPAVVAPVFTDNCDEFTVDFSEVIVDEFSSDEQILVRTWVATDEAGNSTTVTQTITINDGIAPAIVSQPSDVTVDCGSDIPAVVAPVFTDNCEEFIVDFSEVIVDEFSSDEQIIVRTWVATDEAGNSTTVTQTITINDGIAPAIVSQPSDVTVACGSDIPAVVAPVFTDNCDEYIVDFSEVIVDEFSSDEQVILRTWVATDEAGNSTTVTQTITVADIIAPAIVSQPSDVTVPCGSDIPVVVAPVFTDNCDEFIVDFSEVIVDESSTDEQVIVRTWVATDEAGNSTTVTQTITIEDNVAPVIVSQPSDVTVDCGSDIPAVVAPVFTDNCDEFIVDFSESLFDEFSSDEQVIVRTWVATDEAGNSTTVTQTITVEDTTAPAIVSQPSDVTVDCGSDIPAIVAPVFTDNCTEFTVDFSEVITTDASTDEQVLTRTWVATDEAGNSTTVVQVVTIDDNQAPVIVSQPADETVDCGSDIPAIVAPVFTDNCDEFIVDFSEVLTTDASTDEQILTRTWVATDEAGNSTTVVQVITINDTTAPVIANVPVDVTVNCGDEIPAVATPTITDNCDEVFVDFSETITQITFGSGIVITRTWVATDAAGNSTTAVQIVTVLDTEDPTIVCSTEPTSFSTDDDECSYKVTDESLDPTADDNCDVYTVTHNYAMAPQSNSLNGAQFPVGSTEVGFTVTDAAGNTAECSITIDVSDNEAPTFANCPTTMVMVGNDVDECTGKLNWSIPVATDNCEMQLVTQTGGPASGTAVPVGTAMTVTYTATDIYGNAADCVFEVQVIDTQDPEFDADIVMPGNMTVQCDDIPAPFVLTNDDVYDNCTASADLVIDYTEVSTQGADPADCGYYNYTLTRTWTITDMAGNVRTHVQIVTVEDTTPPVPMCSDDVVVLDLFGNGSIDPVVLIAGTTDNCAAFGNLTVNASAQDFDCDDLGLNTVTLTINDPCGNTATCDITVEVVEGDAPCTPEYDITGSDPCVCLDNATTLDNGQFGEVLVIQSLAGQTWTIQSSTGLYTTTSPAPPAAPVAVPNGTTMTAFGNGTFYRLEGRHVDAVGFSVTLVNNVGQVFTFSNTCHYPTPIVDVPNEICLGTSAFVPEVTDQFAGAGAYVSIDFEIDGNPATEVDPAALGLGQYILTTTVNAGTAANDRFVNGVSIDAGNPELDPGCEQSVDLIFNIVATPSQVTCNDNINLTIEPDCDSEITPDQLLEGSYACFDDYIVELFQQNGVVLSPANVVTSANIGQTLVFQMSHPISGNVCWGHITVEDKNDPVATCPPNVDVYCTVDPDSVVYWLPPSHPDYPARDFFGNLVPSGICDSVLYFGHPTATDCSPLLPDNCNGRTWTFNDDYTTYDCAANPALIADIVRTFVVEDIWGNYTTCEQRLTWKRGEADQINWPTDYHIACNDIDLPGLIASDYSPYEYTGRPYIYDDNGYLNTTDNGICELGLTYEDQLVNICAEEYKVVRTWTVYDWCPEQGNPTITEYVQNIKVQNVAPVINVTCFDYTPGGMCILNATEPGNMPEYACSAIYVPFADIDAGCDELVEVSVETPLGNTGNGGVLPSPGLPIGGPYTITYRAEDKCGNITQYDLVVMVEDHTAPIAICDEITSVNLTSLGQAEVEAEVFDDGSYDGCALSHFLVSKSFGQGCTGSFFGPTVTFDCCDAQNSPTMVVFRAVDYAGNTNDCMVEVHVNDKTPPILVSCPANERVSCDWYADALETQLANAASGEDQCDILSQYFGTAVYQDDCNPDVSCNVVVDLDQCLEGDIRRTWVAEDGAGNTNSSQNCNQTIFVDHVSDFVVEFPEDKTVECGTDVPDFGEPEIFYESCELVAVSYEDELFTDVDSACYKIARQWTVINWCVVGDEIDQEVTEDSEEAMRNAGCLSSFQLECDLDGDGDCDDRTFRDSWAICNLPDAAHATQSTNPDTDTDSDPWDGFITYEQVIKVNDTVDPVFTNGCDIDDICISDNTCSATFVLPTPEIDECSSFVTFDVVSSFGSGFGPFAGIAPGTYDVRYVAMDNCNNQTACETTVNVVDCKKPTPYCKSGLVVELMVVNPAMVEVWASDLDANSFDNCPGALTFSFSADVNDIGITFDCDDLGQNTVEMWVTDASGNQDFCITSVNIQANMDQCDDDPTVAVAGSINTEANEGVEDVNVQLSGFGQMSVMTDVDGSFSFPVDIGGDYTVTPTKDDNHLNGVTTYDLVLITKHILGVKTLDSPYKMIAADANKSNTITTFDLVQVRKLILYIYDEFPSNTSWRFVDKGYVFPNSLNPWDEIFPEVANFNNVDVDVLDADYVGVKIGDVNGSAAPNFAGAGEDRNTVGSLVFDVEDRRLEAGQTYTVDFKANDFNVQGYQFSMNFDQDAVEFVDIVPAVAGAENFGLSLLDEGVITASWNDSDVSLAGDQVIFTMIFQATQNVNLSEALVVNSRYTVAEAYNTNGELLDVELAFNGSTIAAAFELYQNTPNPFSKSTVIGFTLPEASTATMTITDVSGKVVKVLNGDFQRGYNEFKLERREFTSKGILYYQLDTDTDSATKMMILVD